MPKIEPNFFLPEGADININPNTRKYTNADLPKEFHPPDVLDDAPDDVMDETPSPPDVMDDLPQEQVADTVSKGGGRFHIPEADTYGTGFMRSMLDGTALDAGMRGGKAFLKGAITDLPSDIVDMIKGAGSTFMNKMRGDSSGLDVNNPGVGINPANPEEFGEGMGRLMGQPLTTYGLSKAAPGMIRGAGYPTELAGKVIKNYGVGLPRIFESRLQRGIERGIGGGIERLGQGMKNVGKNSSVVKQGELVSEEMPDIKEGEIVKPVRKELPSSKVFHYGTEGANPPGKIRVINGKITGPVDSPLQEGQSLTPDAEVSYRRPLTDGEELSTSKPKVRLMPDGSFVNLDTGEMFDAKGQPLGNPQMDKNSPFFKRNQSSPLDIINNEKGSVNFNFKSSRLPRHEPTGELKNYNNVTLESPTGERMTVGDLIKKTGSSISPEAILEEMGTGQGLAKYKYKIIG